MHFAVPTTSSINVIAREKPTHISISDRIQRGNGAGQLNNLYSDSVDFAPRV